MDEFLSLGGSTPPAGAGQSWSSRWSKGLRRLSPAGWSRSTP
jgi:hypothetical protein